MREITVMSVIQSLLFILVMEDFYSSCLKRKCSNKKIHILLWGGYFIYHLFFMTIWESVLMKTVGNLLMIFIVLLLGYQESILTKLIFDFLGLFLISAVEAIWYTIILIFADKSYLSNPINGILCNVIFWLVFHFVFGFIMRKRINVDRKKYLFFLCVAVLVNGIVGLIISQISIRATDHIVHQLALGLSVTLLIIDVVGFKIYILFLERLHIRNENEKYLLQIHLNEKQMEEKQAIMDDVRRIRHDMKQQLIYLQGLVKKNPETVDIYLSKLVEEINSNQETIINSNNLVIDTLIDCKYSLARKLGIPMQCQITIPPDLPQDVSDLCIIMGNLLDNAIEASKEVKEKKREINITLKYEHKKLYINVKNPYEGQRLKSKEGEFITSKNDKKNHGMGLKSIRKIVEKNEGVIVINTENNIFDITIII